jgi:hypothetical protein
VHGERVHTLWVGISGSALSELMCSVATPGANPPPGLWALALRHLARKGAGLLYDCNATMLARAAHAVATVHGPGTAAGDTLKAVKVIDRVAVRLPLNGAFSHQNCAMLAYNFARVGYATARWYAHLAAASGRRDWSGIGPQSIANLLHGYALAQPQGVDDVAGLVDDMIVAAAPQLARFSRQNASNFLWALARLEQPLGTPQLLRRVGMVLGGAEPGGASDLLDLLLERGVAQYGDRFGAQNSSMVIWACGKLQKAHGAALLVRPSRVASLVAALQRDIQSSEPQAIANTLLGAVALGHPLSYRDGDMLVRALVDRVASAGAVGDHSQAVACTIWACAKGGFELPHYLMRSLVDCMVRILVYRPGQTAPLAGANAAWGIAKSGFELGAEEVEYFSRYFATNLERCRPREVSRFLWVLSQVVATCPKPATYTQLPPKTARLLAELPPFVRENSKRMSPQVLSNTALAAASLRYHVPGLMQALTAAAPGCIRNLKPRELSNFMWALATLEPEHSAPFFKHWQELVAAKLRSCNAQNVCNLAWAYGVVLGRGVGLELAVALFERAARVQDELYDEGKRQLFALLVLLPELQAALARRPELLQLADECRAARMSSVATSRASKTQREVYEAVRGWEGVEAALRHEQAVGGAMVCVHVALKTAGGEQVAVELVQRAKYTRSHPRRELGGVALNRSVLESCGWRVVAIPLHEWMQESDKERYLRAKLQLKGLGVQGQAVV